MDTVKVPPQFESVFKTAEKYVREYFKEFKADPSKGTIEISDERYILVRAASMSVDFFETIKNLYRGAGEDEAHNVALQLLFDVAHAIGKQDAKKFHIKMGVEDPVARLSAGPILFAYTGWAHVNISSESKPTPDENFYLLYDHPYSFESSAWIKQGMHSKFPVCIMNAGYSSGWCEESFGVPLVATEITCKAKGDDACRFIMGHHSKIESYIKKYIKKTPSLANKNINYEIPGFFKRKELEEQLRQSEARYRTQFEESIDAIFIADFVSGTLVDCNKAAEKLVERTREEIIGKPQRILHPDNEALGALSKTFLQHTDDSMGQALESEVVTKSGDIKYVSIRANILNLQGRKLLNGVFRDVTARRRTEIALRKRMDFEQIIGNIAKLFSGLSYDKLDDGLQNSLNTVAKHVGFSRAYIFLFSANRKTLSCIHEWFASGVKSLFHSLQNFSPKPYKNLLNAMEYGEMVAIMDVESLPKSWNDEKKLWKKLDVKSLIAFPLILQNECIGFVGFDAVHEKKLWDVDNTSLLTAYSEIVAAALERKRVDEKMEQLAKYDSLTNLPNRLYFEETLEREIAKALRHNYMFSILSLDLDKFKFVNDTFGHSVGDLLLVEIAERLRTTVRKEDFIARLGGDEFVSIIIAISSPHAAGVIAKKIVSAIGMTYTVGGHEFTTSASLGIAVFPDDGSDVETLMKNADIAMYQAKQNGGNNYQYYHCELSKQHLKRMHLENALKSALLNDEFFLVYRKR
ncbi:MAG: diguanylate cyclase [Gammaproteobacteria bacterium]|nr:diguanylate cyclase [Gammaproteobacteria bacterium]